MEATHLGALHQHATRAALTRALKELGRRPELPANLQNIVTPDGTIDRRLVKQAHAWLRPAYRIRRRIKHPGESLAIPTWLYGHEPTTALATQVAKYFQNSVREDRLLAVATHGPAPATAGSRTPPQIFSRPPHWPRAGAFVKSDKLLEKVSVHGEIGDFTKFVAEEMKASAKLKPHRRERGSN
jgi:hypothetical protein